MSVTNLLGPKELNKEDKKSDREQNMQEDNQENKKNSKNASLMSSGEYAENFRWWWYQQQCIHQMNIASYQFLYNLHLLATYNYFNQLRPAQPLPSPTNTTPSSGANITPPRRDNLRGRECGIPALWRRLVAELIDFLLLVMLKMGVTFFILDNTDLLGPLEGDMEKLLSIKWTPENAYRVLPDLIMLECINRIFISVFEALSLRQGTRGWVGGSTPGKRFMGLKVVYCERVVATTTPGRVLVVPATDLLFSRALLRSLLKNLSYIIIPMFLTSFIFENNRSLYDIASSSIVVYVGEEYADNFRA